MADFGFEESIEDVFADTCVLFAYAVEGDDDARKVFHDHVLEKVVSERIEREFESVADRQQDIHRELLEFAASGDLEEYEPADLSQKNDVRYVVDLYSELTNMDDEVEIVRRLNELVNRLEKAREELFGSDGAVTIVSVDGVDAQLMGMLRSVVENDADVRVLCDAVAWRRNGGSGVFLTEDTEDILGNDADSVASESGGIDDDDGGDNGLSDSFEDFWGTDDKSVPEQINERVSDRYGADSTLRILSTGSFVTKENVVPNSSD